MLQYNLELDDLRNAEAVIWGCFMQEQCLEASLILDFILNFQGVDVEHLTNTNHPGMLICKFLIFHISFVHGFLACLFLCSVFFRLIMCKVLGSTILA